MPYDPRLPDGVRVQVGSTLPLGTCEISDVHLPHEVRLVSVEPYFCDGNLDRELWGIRQSPVNLSCWHPTPGYIPEGYSLVPDDVVATLRPLRDELDAYRCGEFPTPVDLLEFDAWLEGK